MTNIINKVIKNGTEYQIYASGGAAITVDSELSTTSTNPAQNKVITTAINSKAADNAVVKLTGNQTVAGTKTFSTSPVVPSKNSAASSSNKTVIATEAQVALKQDALTLPSSPTSGHIVTWGANNKTLADGGSIPTVNNSTITFTQGGVSKGTITTNQSSASTIALDAGGNYDNITKSEIQTGTATTQRTVSASVIKSALPRISSLPNNILTNCELWAGKHSDYKAMGDGRPSTTLFFCIDDGWKPSANTLIYYKFDGNLNDSSGNSRNGTAGGTITYGTNYVDLTNGYITVPNITYKNDTTVSMRFKLNNITVTSGEIAMLSARDGGAIIQVQRYNSSGAKFATFTDKPSYSLQFLGSADTQWHLYNFVANSSGVKYYLDGTLYGTKSAWTGSYTPSGTKIGTYFNSSSPNVLKQYNGEFIIEDKARTADEISVYYNKSKSKYGL